MKKISFRIALGAWCLAAVVLANAYGSTLVSFLTVSELEPIINSWEELANNNPTLKLLTEENSPSIKIIFLVDKHVIVFKKRLPITQALRYTII